MNRAIATRQDYDDFETQRALEFQKNFWGTDDPNRVIAPRHTIADEVEGESLARYPANLREAATEIRVRGLRIDEFPWREDGLPFVEPCRVEETPSENSAWANDPLGMVQGRPAAPVKFYGWEEIDELVDLLARERKYWRPEVCWAAARGMTWRQWSDQLAGLNDGEYDVLYCREIEQFEHIG